jgi:hypothetical protein
MPEPAKVKSKSGPPVQPVAVAVVDVALAIPVIPNTIAAAIGTSLKKFFIIYLFYKYKLMRS